MTFQSGPVNISQGNSAQFVVEYFDADGDLTVPTTAEMTVTYVNTSNGTSVDSVTMTLSNSFFTGTWSSATAALGLATWVATADGGSTTQATGQLRIIDPEV